VYFFNL